MQKTHICTTKRAERQPEKSGDTQGLNVLTPCDRLRPRSCGDLSPAERHYQQAFDVEIARQLQEVETLMAQAEDSPLRQRLRALGKLP